MQMLKGMAAAAIIYAAFQAAFSGYFFRKARKLTKTSYSGKSEHGKGRRIRVFVAGDSIAAGVGASEAEKCMARRIAAALAKNNRVILTNAAKSGSKMKDMAIVPKEKQDIAIIVASSNDLYHFTPLKQFEKDTTKALQLYTKFARKVVIVGPGNIGGATAIPLVLKPWYALRRPQYAAIMKKASAKHKNTTVVNPAGFSTKPYGRIEASDGFHPNDNGHRYWADVAMSALSS